MIKDFVVTDSQKKVRHRAIIGSIADFVDAGHVPMYTTGKKGKRVNMKKMKGFAVKHDFSGYVKLFRTEESAEGYLRRVYA
jgi:hypothetical protein